MLSSFPYSLPPKIGTSRKVNMNRLIKRLVTQFSFMLVTSIAMAGVGFAQDAKPAAPAEPPKAPIADNTANAGAKPGEVVFQIANNTQRSVAMKLFSRGESKQVWPSQSRAFSLRPDSAVQQLKFSCTEGENICWGAWFAATSESGEIHGDRRQTSHMKVQFGVGDRGMRDCQACCFVCKAGTMTHEYRIGTTQDNAK
jgi:hypothetical protein